MFPFGRAGFTMRVRIPNLSRNWSKSTSTRWGEARHSCSIFRRIKMGSLIKRLYEFAAYRNELYKEDLALGAKVSGPALSADFACHHLTDGLETSSWASDADLPIQLELDLGSPKTFDVIELREDLKLGQRIVAFHVQVEVDGIWQEFGMGFTVGHKRLLRGPLVEAQKVRVMITESQDLPVMTKISLYKTPSLSKKKLFRAQYLQKKVQLWQRERLFILRLNVANVTLLWRLRFRFNQGQVSMVSPIRTRFKSLRFKLGNAKKICIYQPCILLLIRPWLSI